MTWGYLLAVFQPHVRGCRAQCGRGSRVSQLSGGSCPRGAAWMMGEQKGFAVAMADKLKSNWLLRSPETEQADGRVPDLPPQP